MLLKALLHISVEEATRSAGELIMDLIKRRDGNLGLLDQQRRGTLLALRFVLSVV